MMITVQTLVKFPDDVNHSW